MQLRAFYSKVYGMFLSIDQHSGHHEHRRPAPGQPIRGRALHLAPVRASRVVRTASLPGGAHAHQGGRAAPHAGAQCRLVAASHRVPVQGGQVHGGRAAGEHGPAARVLPSAREVVDGQQAAQVRRRHAPAAAHRDGGRLEHVHREVSATDKSA